MMPRVNYEMSESDLRQLLDACKPTPVMYLSGGVPLGSSPQENANRAWGDLGRRLGFDWNTVRPIDGKGNRFFSAVPLETPEQTREREEREAAEKRDREIRELRSEIVRLTERLEQLESNR